MWWARLPAAARLVVSVNWVQWCDGMLICVVTASFCSGRYSGSSGSRGQHAGLATLHISKLLVAHAPAQELCEGGTPGAFLRHMTRLAALRPEQASVCKESPPAIPHRRPCQRAVLERNAAFLPTPLAATHRLLLGSTIWVTGSQSTHGFFLPVPLP